MRTARSVLPRLATMAVVALLATAASCALLTDPSFPKNARQFRPPIRFLVWWRLVQSCAGQTGEYSQVRWYTVPAGSLWGSGQQTTGRTYLWGGPRIVLDEAYAFDNEGLVRHEMLHALLNVGGHPRQFFVEQ